MSTDGKDKQRRIIRRSIPQLIPRPTDKKSEGSSKPQEKASPKDGTGTAKTNKNKLEKKLSNYREKVDDHPRARPPLSLQGPFNPNIVGHRKTSDESKRKRNPTPTRQTDRSSPGTGGTTTTAKSAAPSTISSSLFPTVIPETDDPKPKRNHGQDKQKCSVDFSLKADTKFADNVDKSILFTASGQAGNTVGSRRPPRDRVRRVSGGGTRVTDFRRSDKVLRENVQLLEGEKQVLLKKHAKEVSDLTSKLNDAQDTVEKLKKDNVTLEKTLEEQELQNNVSDDEKTKCLSLHNETLEKQLEVCQRRLEELNVDPVSLSKFEGGDVELLSEGQRKAAEEAEKLRRSLKEINKRNHEIVDKLKETKENHPVTN